MTVKTGKYSEKRAAKLKHDLEVGELVERHKAISLFALRKEGWGNKRLLRFNDNWDNTLMDISRGNMTVEDILTTLNQETGITGGDLTEIVPGSKRLSNTIDGSRYSLRGGVKVTKPNKDLLHGYDNMARSMQRFLYEGRPGRSKPIKHTEKEYREFIENTVRKCWDMYNKGVIDFGGF